MGYLFGEIKVGLRTARKVVKEKLCASRFFPYLSGVCSVCTNLDFPLHLCLRGISAITYLDALCAIRKCGHGCKRHIF